MEVKQLRRPAAAWQSSNATLAKAREINRISSVTSAINSSGMPVGQDNTRTETSRRGPNEVKAARSFRSDFRSNHQAAGIGEI